MKKTIWGILIVLVVAGVALLLSGSGAAPQQVANEVGKRCGGNMATAYHCATGYHCAPIPGSHLPFGDVGGTCVAD